MLENVRQHPRAAAVHYVWLGPAPKQGTKKSTSKRGGPKSAGPVAMPIKAHFHSRKISTDRKFSENIVVKSRKFSTSKFFSDA
jgi:hypothetical protein